MITWDCSKYMMGFNFMFIVWIVVLCVHIALQMNMYEKLEFSGAESKQDYFELVTDEWSGSAFYDITISTD